MRRLLVATGTPAAVATRFVVLPKMDEEVVANDVEDPDILAFDAAAAVAAVTLLLPRLLWERRERFSPFVCCKCKVAADGRLEEDVELRRGVAMVIFLARPLLFRCFEYRHKHRLVKESRRDSAKNVLVVHAVVVAVVLVVPVVDTVAVDG
jgi:hypothetical protein